MLRRLSFAVALLFLMNRIALPASAGTTVWQGVYTSAQAARGEAVYAAECSRCHREDLSGYGNVLIGNVFMTKWREDNLQSFFNLVKSTMPRNAPASLSDDAYLDVVAYILQQNAFPAGEKDLKQDALPDIRIEGKQGPQAVPDFSLVEVVGCLSQRADGEWMLTKATEPVRTRNPKESSPDELKALDAESPGAHTFRLMDATAANTHPPAHHKVVAKGFLIRQPGDDRINTSDLQSIAPTCSDR